MEITDNLLDAVESVESSGNPNAINKASGARGAFQFLPIAWKDVVQNYPEMKRYSDYEDNSMDRGISREFAKRLMELNVKRLGKKANLDNVLASYNYGIGHVRKGHPIPPETVDYIKKVRAKMSEKKLNGMLEMFGIKK